MKFRLFTFSLNFIVALVCFVRISANRGYELMILLPVVFAFCILLFPNMQVLAAKYIGIKILYATMWLRYTAMPLMTALSSDVTGQGLDPSYSSIQIAVLMMVIEMVGIFFIVTNAGRRLLLRTGLEQNFDVKQTYGVPVPFYTLIFLSVGLLVVYPGLLNNFAFGFFDGRTRITSYFFGLDIRLIMISQMALICILVNALSKMYVYKKNNLYYYLSLLLGAINILILTGENRATLVITIVPTIFLLKLAFPQKNRTTNVVMAAVGTGMLLSLSLYRIFAVTPWRPQGGEAEINFNFFARMLQEYLAGPRNIGIGLDAMNYYSTAIGLRTFFSDILVWTGYLGNYVSEFLGEAFIGTSYLFNSYLYNGNMYGSGDQIVPLIVQSYAYFGYLGFFIFSLLASYSLVLFDVKICRVSTLNEMYVHVMFATVLGLFMGYNVSILMLYYFDRYLIFLLFNKGNDILAPMFRNKNKVFRRSMVSRGGY